MRHWIGLLVALLFGGCAATVSPTSAGAATAADTPPLIAGRVAAIEGDVSIWRVEEDGGGQWDRAQVNDVVTVGTGLTTGAGRVEVRVGPHALRLGADTTGGFSQLDFGVKNFSLERGVVNIRLAPAQQGEAVTLQVGGVSIALAAPGRYRIDAIDNSPLNVTAFEGQATVRYAGASVAISAGQALAMTQSNMSFGTATTTALDEWGQALDARYQQAQAVRYVSPYMTGYEELDLYGNWLPDATYGTVWVPRAVPVGWAPYRDGRWRWIAPWGWTWVDTAPWGYAPFHYGRWVMLGGRWCWWPGGYVARPVWAPALVGFVGAGGVSVSGGFGGQVVGWYPLAPWNVYRPHYRTNTTYVTTINQTIIQRPPPGVPHDVNQRPGSTWVPGTRFQEPVAKVRIPAQTAKVADLQPMAPPPRPKRTAAVADNPPSSLPSAPSAPPYTRGAPGGAPPPPRYVAPTQPPPAAVPPRQQPGPIQRVEPRVLPPAAGQWPEREAPRPKTTLPTETVPPHQPLQRPYPAEPVRTPATPPTVRQPAVVPTPAPRATPPTAAPPVPPHATPPSQGHRGPAPGEPSRGTPPGTPGGPSQHDVPPVRVPKPDIPPPKPVAQ